MMNVLSGCIQQSLISLNYAMDCSAIEASPPESMDDNDECFVRVYSTVTYQSEICNGLLSHEGSPSRKHGA